MFKNPLSIINQAYYFALSIAILNLALPMLFWLLQILPLMPLPILVREVAFSLLTILLAVLMKYKKQLFAALLLLILAFFQLG
ncbi:MAG: hypothetical protein WC371_02685, partial [Parachlamydiales bacterium]